MAGWLDKLTLRKDLSPARVAAKPDLATLLAEGNRLLDAGRLSEAEAKYAEALQHHPTATAASVNLGYVRMAQGRADEAVQALDRALGLEPDNVDALLMLGVIELDRGRPQAAIARLEAALTVRPGFLPVHAPLVRALVADGRHDEALVAAEAGLRIEPTNTELLFLRGNLLRVAGHREEAIGAYRAALASEPRFTEARIALGQLLIEAEDFVQARDHLEQSLAQRPTSVASCTQLGDSLLAIGLVDAACAAYAMALERDPNHVAALQNLSIAQSLRGQHEAARDAAARLTQVAPDLVDGWRNLAASLESLGLLADAQRCLQHASALAPDDARTLTMLATLDLRRGDTLAALSGFERALAIDPDSEIALSHYLFALGYVDDSSRYMAAARQFGRLVTKRARPFTDWPAASRTPSPLRVGLVSGDFRAHPVGYFIESVLPHLRAQGLEVVALPTVVHHDEVSARLQSHCSRWVPLPGLSDAAAAARVRDEGIHVLIDLDGHGGRSRLPVFAWRPAPVQATWLGYWASTGVPAIDYLIADPFSVPEDQRDLYTETVWTLPETRLCFTPPAASDGLPIAELPARRNGRLTFGSFQNLSKVGDPVLATWRRVLDAVPGSRLRLQSKQTGTEGAERVRQRFADAGIDGERLVLAPPALRRDYLAAYAEVDLLLDSFPFPGGTTTFEALWMGVPTVSLRGRSMVANQGRLILANAGLADWVARDVDEYVSIAVDKAADLDALAALRSGMRERVLASPLFDARRFASHLAGALHAIWSRHAGR